MKQLSKFLEFISVCVDFFSRNNKYLDEIFISGNKEKYVIKFVKKVFNDIIQHLNNSNRRIKLILDLEISISTYELLPELVFHNYEINKLGVLVILMQ